MFKKKALFLGFAALLAAAIFTFAACGGDDDGKDDTTQGNPNNPVDDPALNVYKDWATNQAYFQRFTLDYSLNLDPAARAGKETSRLFYTLEERDGSGTKKTVIEDYCDYTKTPEGDADQTGASVKGSSSRSTSRSANSWSTIVAAVPGATEDLAGSLNSPVFPGGIRGLMLYAVAPSNYITFEDLQITKVGKKLTFTYTHNQTSAKLWTDDNGEWVFPADSTPFPGISQSVQTCLPANGRPAVNWMTDDAAFNAVIRDGDPTKEQIKATLPYEKFRPYPVLNGIDTIGSGDNSSTPDYLLATTKTNGGRFDKRNLDWTKVTPALTPSSGTGITGDSEYKYVGKLTANLDEAKKILTVKGDLVLVKK